eukprot:2987087-Rhodomonas_salina.1
MRRCAMCCTGKVYQPTSFLCGERYWHILSAYALPLRYAVLPQSISLRASSAVSGTDVVYQPMSLLCYAHTERSALRWVHDHWHSAVCGTEMAYGASARHVTASGGRLSLLS